MNAEKLHSIAKAIQQDFAKTNVVTVLGNLVNSLQNQINQPQQPQHQQQVVQQLQQIPQQLSKASSNDFSPLWKQILAELGFADLLGSPLAERITEIFEHNKITPAAALSQLKEVQQKLVDRKNAIDQLLSAFATLGIGSEELDPGECELGVLVPRNYVDNKLAELGKEFEELQGIFGVFEEIATGSRPGLDVRAISSSDFGVFLCSAPAVLALLSHAVEKILGIYKNYLEVRKLHNELKKQQLPEDSLTGISEHLNKMIEEGIEKAVDEIIKSKTIKGDSGRKNELKIELRIAMNKLANRIDRGFNIEIRMRPPEHEDKNGKNQEYYAEIANNSSALTFIKAEGPPILTLPETTETKEKRGKASKKDGEA